MSATTLFLVRHGETDPNRHRIMQGRGLDAALNATGRQQAEAVAQRFAETSLEAIYASGLRRAIETAETVHRHHPALTVHQNPDLDEMAWGVYEGTPPSPERDAALAAIYQDWDAGRYEAAVDGGESILDVQTRGVRAIQSIAESHAGETVLVVTHGRMLRVLLASLLDGYTLDHMDTFDHSNTGVNELRYRQGRYEPRTLNCTAHLDGTADPSTATLSTN
ncbi:MAG: histidine phosphatase family protein [Bacteroidetes bacterium]|jgi:broad specificity phosphatase PhoE|nr:histidine phosphatase family protein [Bacteroidota bacterium]